MDGGNKLHIAMYPWFAMGHLTFFLHIANKLAARGHRISFLIPEKTRTKLTHFNFHTDLITFVPLVVPHVQGLPLGAETTSDVSFPLHSLLMTAMDLTETQVEALLLELKPDLVFFDSTHWTPALTRKLGIKSVHYCTVSAASIAYLLSPERMLDQVPVPNTDQTQPPLGFPPSAVKLHGHEAKRSVLFKNREFGSGITVFHTDREKKMDRANKLHIAMYPWFAMGHLTSFLHIANKLATRGHRISFLIPEKTRTKLTHFNLHPDLITFVPLVVPHVHGLPLGGETTSDVPFPLHPLLMTAMDLTETQVEALLVELKPDIVFFDFTHWTPALTRRLGIKSVHYCIVSAASIAYLLSPERMLDQVPVPETDLTQPPLGFPPSAVKLHGHEANRSVLLKSREFGSGITFNRRQMISLKDCDALAFKSCREMEGIYCEYLESQFKKPILLSGPVVPQSTKSTLDEKWVKFLSGFKEGTMVYCAFGSECTLTKEQFVELVLGLELTGLPFLAALKPPFGVKSIEEALPEGFKERVEGRGVVEGGWLQQQLILAHPSLGCFVTHCGFGSLTEALVNDGQLVLLPQFGEQIVNARLMEGDLKVGVEVEKEEENGLFTKESVCKAVRLVMDQDNEVAKEVRANHAKWKEFLLKDGLESSYLDEFIEKLKSLAA